MSLDGYIAKPSDDLSFLKLVEKEGEDYGYAEFTPQIEPIIIGRRTYDYVAKEIGASHYDNGQRDIYVITRTKRPKVGRTDFYTGNLTELVDRLISETGKHIYCDGGAEVINELLKHDLIDELIISLIPSLLGSGTRLFKTEDLSKHWNSLKQRRLKLDWCSYSTNERSNSKPWILTLSLFLKKPPHSISPGRYILRTGDQRSVR